MPKKDKKSKCFQHVTYYQKFFLAGTKSLSMSAIRTSIDPEGIAQIMISDNKRTITISNDLNKPEEVKELIETIETIQSQLENFKTELKLKKTS